MLHECPNCRERVPFLRSIRTTAWGSFRCTACGSVLGISLGRRLIVGGIWAAIILVTMEILKLHTSGCLISYGFMAVSLVVVFYLLEKIVLLDRRAFTCRQCGYELRGLTESRCPECGTEFDPAERHRILDRIEAPAPRPKYGWLAALVVILLTVAVAAGGWAWRITAKPAPPPPASPAPASN